VRAPAVPEGRTACWVCGTRVDLARTLGSCPVCGWTHPGAPTGTEEDDTRAIVLVVGATVLNLLVLAALAAALLSSQAG
jgi:hypothetical protein